MNEVYPGQVNFQYFNVKLNFKVMVLRLSLVSFQRRFDKTQLILKIK